VTKHDDSKDKKEDKATLNAGAGSFYDIKIRSSTSGEPVGN